MMDLEKEGPKRHEIEAQLAQALNKIPDKARSEKLLGNLQNAVENHLRARYKDLPEESIKAILSDLPSYQNCPNREPTIGRQV